MPDLPASRVTLIAAVAANGVIGADGDLPWRIPEDFAFFKRTTMGHPLVMGRATFDSIGRPLPGRTSIVISRNPAYQAPGATLVTSLEAAVQAAGPAEETFVIGGAELYRQALPFAQRVYLTEIASDFAGDVYFPELAAGEWQEVSRKARQELSELDYAFAIYQRN